MGLMKYFGEQGDQHNGRLFWSSALDGLPFRGNAAPVLTQEEFDTSLETHYDFHSKEFDLTDPEQQKEYVEVMDRICNGLYVEYYKAIKEDQATGRVRYAYLEWLQQYKQLSPSAPREAIASATYTPRSLGPGTLAGQQPAAAF